MDSKSATTEDCSMTNDSNQNIQDKLDKKTEESIKIEHPECKRSIQGKKAVLSKKAEKTYKVTVTYIHVTAEEAKMKRSIIESILKKSNTKPPP
jgi:hypothetical protein